MFVGPTSVVFLLDDEVVATFELLIILHQPAQLFWTTEHGQRIACMQRTCIGGVHLGLVIMSQQDNVEVIVIFHIPDGFIRQV